MKFYGELFKNLFSAEHVFQTETGKIWNETSEWQLDNLQLFQCWNRILKAFANSLDPYETLHNVASHHDSNSPRNVKMCRMAKAAIVALVQSAQVPSLS
ncbi:hypothetical protein DPMN_189334 [Dreissena polymorpha]|uniref:Uncharacterized protein n=1 Tax=Dreissena polymorpha TaxID=45954 RepID=A0A9D4DTC7_DREPO|nr:hypothetical protein DPMN_189334 [Dreissena polymorpha]